MAGFFLNSISVYLEIYIYFTDRGIIVEHGPPATFFEEAKDPRTKEFLSQIL